MHKYDPMKYTLFIRINLESQKILSQFLNLPSMTLLNLSKKCFLISMIKEKVTENVLHTSGYFENFFFRKNIWDDGKSSLSVIIRNFLIFRVTLDESYKPYFCKKKSMYTIAAQP